MDPVVASLTAQSEDRIATAHGLLPYSLASPVFRNPAYSI